MASTSSLPRRRRKALSPLCSLIIVPMILVEVLSGCAASHAANAPATHAASPTATLASTATPTVTPTPRPFTAFTCAAGSLPIGNGYTQVRCTVATDGPYSVLSASFTGQGTNGELDYQRLAADGWLEIDQAHGDSPYGAIGHALYFNESAWFAVEYSYPAATMAIEQGVPMSGPAPVSCGQTLTAGSGQLQGVPTPSGMVTTKAGAYSFAPACLQDVLHFYTSTLPAAGWTLTQSFQPPPGSVAGTLVTAVSAVVSRGSTTLAVWLAGGDGTPTMFAVNTTPPV